jgi:hypothetical protein
LHVSLFGLNGKLLYSKMFSQSVQLPLAEIVPSSGSQVLQVRSGSQTLMNRMVSHIR